MTLIFCILKLSISLGWSWTRYETSLYQNRQFIELEHALFVKRDKKHLEKIEKQEQDLAGCKSIHEGSGRTQSFVRCVRFLNRENDLKLYSPQRKQLVGDLNLICHQFVSKKEFVERILKEEGLLRDQKQWVSCHSEIWQQIYLASYANFLADPVGTLAITRRAEKNLGPDGYWSMKIKLFMTKNSRSFY